MVTNEMNFHLAAAGVRSALNAFHQLGNRDFEPISQSEAVEEYYCNFGIDPSVVPLLKEGPMRIAGTDPEGAIRVLELPEHPFFVATLYVPQTHSRFDAPHPLVTSFLQAALEFELREDRDKAKAASCPRPDMRQSTGGASRW